MRSRVVGLAIDRHNLGPVVVRESRRSAQHVWRIVEREDDGAACVDARVVVVLELGRGDAVSDQNERSGGRPVAREGKGEKVRTYSQLGKRLIRPGDRQAPVESQAWLVDLDWLRVIGRRGRHFGVAQGRGDVTRSLAIAGVTYGTPRKLIARQHRDVRS